MTAFETTAPKYRLVQTHFNDDLPAIAARELGDANRWAELIWLNKLLPPYIVSDPRRVAPNVLLAGALIKVPAPVGLWNEAADYTQVYERDCALVKRRLTLTTSGDLAVFTGADNLRQQLAHRVVTPKGQATRHPEYGCMVWRLMGTVNGPMAGMLGARYVRAALSADYRVKSTQFASADVRMDSVQITAKVVAIEGGVVDVTHKS